MLYVVLIPQDPIDLLVANTNRDYYNGFDMLVQSSWKSQTKSQANSWSHDLVGHQEAWNMYWIHHWKMQQPCPRYDAGVAWFAEVSISPWLTAWLGTLCFDSRRVVITAIQWIKVFGRDKCQQGASLRWSRLPLRKWFASMIAFQITVQMSSSWLKCIPERWCRTCEAGYRAVFIFSNIMNTGHSAMAIVTANHPFSCLACMQGSAVQDNICLNHIFSIRIG